MDFELRFTDKEITAWGGMWLMKRMLDHMGFDGALSFAGLPQPGSNLQPTIHPAQANGKSGFNAAG